MIGTVVRHEWTILRTDGVMRVLGASFVLLTATALVLGIERVSHERRAASLLAQSQNPTDAPLRTPDYIANERGTLAILPTAPLLGLAVGLSDVYPNHYRITARLREAQLVGTQLEAPLVMLTGHVDLLFVMLYLYPLLIVGISYDLTASERATGTLRLLLAQGPSLRDIVAGKVVARLAIVLALPLAACAAGFIVTGSAPGATSRLLIWTAAALAYGLFWLGLGVLVNARGRSAGANALTLAGAWLAFVVLAPAIVNLIMTALLPVPSRVESATTMRVAARAAIVQGSRMLGRFLEDHPSTGTGQEGMRQYYMLQESREDEVGKRLRPLLAAYETQLARQRASVSTLQYASPTILAQLVLTDVAGTSGHRHRWFADQAKRFQKVWKAYFPPDVLAATEMEPERLAERPVFRYAEEPLHTVVRRIAWPIFLLAAVSSGLLCAGLRMYDRCDVSGT